LVRRSDAVDLAQRRRESVIGINLFPVLPLSILISGVHAIEPFTSWIGAIVRFNPVNLATGRPRKSDGEP
jgi:hypothetical protein